MNDETRQLGSIFCIIHLRTCIQCIMYSALSASLLIACYKLWLSYVTRPVRRQSLIGQTSYSFIVMHTLPLGA